MSGKNSWAVRIEKCSLRQNVRGYLPDVSARSFPRTNPSGERYATKYKLVKRHKDSEIRSSESQWGSKRVDAEVICSVVGVIRVNGGVVCGKLAVICSAVGVGWGWLGLAGVGWGNILSFYRECQAFCFVIWFLGRLCEGNQWKFECNVRRGANKKRQLTSCLLDFNWLLFLDQRL